MSFQDLVNKTKDMDLEKMGIVLGKDSTSLNTICAYKENDEWIYKEYDDRGETIVIRDTEEKICKLLQGAIDAAILHRSLNE